MSAFTAIDFETADYGRDSACAIGAVFVRDAEIVRRFRQLIRPPRPDFAFTHIHGITWQDVHDSPSFAELWPLLRGFVEDSDFLVAHNAAFDRGVLAACCRGAGIAMPRRRFACTVKAARATWSLPSARLPVVCAHLGIPLRHHDPLSDAEACATIAIRAMEAGATL